MFPRNGNSRDYFAQGLLGNNRSPPIAQKTTNSSRQSTASDPKRNRSSRDYFAEGLLPKKPPPQVAQTTPKPLRPPRARDPVDEKKSPTTTRHHPHSAKNSDASIGMTHESSSQATTKFAGSTVSTVDSEHPTTTTTSKSLDTEYENLVILPPPPVEQDQIHHNYENNRDHDDAIDDTQEESASEILRQKQLKDLMDKCRLYDEKIMAMKQAIQDLSIVGEGKEDDTITLGSTESMVVTVQSTPHTSPVTKVETRVSTANSVKSDEDITTQDVRNIEWTVAAPLRRNGRYSGTALNGKIPHGRGVLVFNDEEVYQGPFKYGVMQGSNGLLVSASGATYEGGFRLNLRHGYGKEVFACGSRYVGEFEKGLPHGFGERRNPDGTLFFVGQWVQGERAGPEDVMEQDNECLICLEPFSQENPRVPTLCGCGTNKTRVHLPCLYEWMKQKRGCPSCRQVITWEES